MKRRHIPRDPTRATNPKHREALAWMAARGIDQPRGIDYQKPVPVPADIVVTYGPLSRSGAVIDPRKLKLV